MFCKKGSKMANKNEEIAISIKNLTKIYRLYKNPKDRLKESLSFTRKKYHKEFYALNNISFEIKKGDTVGIIGKNGSGKSTLLKIITGVLTPTTGNVFVSGKIAALLELGAGFNLEYTGLENIYLQGTIMGFSKNEMDKKLKDILDFAEIGDYIYQPVKTYSSGMFARLAFAVAINVDPEILIVDEALAVGDVRFQAKCFKKFEELKKQGVTIIFVTHDIFSVRNLCSSAIWINEGQLIVDGDTAIVTAKYLEFMNSDQIDFESTTFLAAENSINSITETKKSEFKEINRWGKAEGCIKYVEIINSKAVETDSFETGEMMKIIFGFTIPNNVDTKYLSAAFSIKNKLGVDLIVSTTQDYINKEFNEKGQYFEVSYEFLLPLNEGEYIVNLALEDRKNGVPDYYDYIEGATYFKVVSKNHLYGIFIPEIKQEIICIQENNNGE